MTLGEMLNIIIPLTGADYESDIISHINSAQLKLAQTSHTLKYQNVTVGANGKVEIPSDCLYIRDVFYKNYWVPHYPENGYPDNSWYGLTWVKDGNYIVFIPELSQGATVQLVYTPKPSELVNDEDETELEFADEYLIAYAVYRTRAETMGVFDETTNYWGDKANAAFANWVDLNKKRHARPRFVKVREWR